MDSVIEALESSFSRNEDGDYASMGAAFYDGAYGKTFEMFFEEVMDQMADSRIFNDQKYLEKLDVRIKGNKEYDQNGCLTREAKGLIDFDKIVNNATSRVVTAFEDPSFHPSKMEFNAGAIGPFESGIIHASIYLMVNFMLIELSLIHI